MRTYSISVYRWIDLSIARTDVIAKDKVDGKFVKNMKRFVKSFASQHGLSPSFLTLNTWHAPYTNCMYINAAWYRDEVLLHAFDKSVLASGCIYSGRWGDLPLWGAKLQLIQEPRRTLNFSYEHRSHRVVVKPGRIYGRVFS